MKLAAIDLGSNTLKYTLAEVTADALTVIRERAEITRIGQGLDKNGYLLDGAMERTYQVLAEVVADARTEGAEHIACVATAGMRGASNAQGFLDRVRHHLGLEIEIIHGLREAELAFRAPAAAFGPGPLLVVDVGGRSTELIYGSVDGIVARVSLEIGGVRLTERFLPDDPPKDADLAALFAHLKEILQAAPPVPEGTQMVGVSGTVVSLMGAHLGYQDIQLAVAHGEGQRLARADIERLYEDLRRVPAAERIRGTVIPAGRADVIVAGAAVILAALDHYGLDGLTVSNRGVRFGLLFEHAARLT
ncbi:MAG: Ppx/GppA family phosphatase [Deltaproteobacteria bacterium]|nr:Ppx/GppA family phosphatase [Deltaproteobacteria bacterium]